MEDLQSCELALLKQHSEEQFKLLNEHIEHTATKLRLEFHLQLQANTEKLSSQMTEQEKRINARIDALDRKVNWLIGIILTYALAQTAAYLVRLAG